MSLLPGAGRVAPVIIISGIISVTIGFQRDTNCAFFRRFGDDVNHASHGRTTVKDRGSATHDFDLFNVINADLVQINRRTRRRNERLTVHEH
jgi:hypothetical protein|tara:strand:- start:2464 stop:2739 length:276 start_codon:yes stop_codon:yes gene_type:complete